MAKDKDSFVLYADQIHIFEDLTDAEAGRLIKHVFRYVNDQNPECKDRVVNIAFVPIKQQLKRDLKKWEGSRAKRSEAGKLGASKRWQTMANDGNAINGMAKMAVNVNGNVNVNERDSGPPGFWEKEKLETHNLEHCKEVALRDEDWVRSNKTNPVELGIFNNYLIGTGCKEKTFLDYKNHFHHKKKKDPQLFGVIEKKMQM